MEKVIRTGVVSIGGACAVLAGSAAIIVLYTLWADGASYKTADAVVALGTAMAMLAMAGTGAVVAAMAYRLSQRLRVEPAFAVGLPILATVVALVYAALVLTFVNACGFDAAYPLGGERYCG